MTSYCIKDYYLFVICIGILFALYRTCLFLFFRHPDDIDLFAGGMSETPLPGSILGPTFQCLIAYQFSLYKHGDRFWYERTFPENPLAAFTPGKVMWSISSSTQIKYNNINVLLHFDIIKHNNILQWYISLSKPCYSWIHIHTCHWRQKKGWLFSRINFYSLLIVAFCK